MSAGFVVIVCMGMVCATIILGLVVIATAYQDRDKK